MFLIIIHVQSSQKQQQEIPNIIYISCNLLIVGNLICDYRLCTLLLTKLYNQLYFLLFWYSLFKIFAVSGILSLEFFLLLLLCFGIRSNGHKQTNLWLIQYDVDTSRTVVRVTVSSKNFATGVAHLHHFHDFVSARIVHLCLLVYALNEWWKFCVSSQIQSVRFKKGRGLFLYLNWDATGTDNNRRIRIETNSFLVYSANI